MLQITVDFNGQFERKIHSHILQRLYDSESHEHD